MRYCIPQVVGSIGFLVGEGITCYNTMCQPWNLVFRGSCLAGWPVGHTSMMHTTSGWWFMRRCGIAWIAELCINHLQFGNLNSDTFWMILQFQYPFCHCVVTPVGMWDNEFLGSQPQILLWFVSCWRPWAFVVRQDHLIGWGPRGSRCDLVT